MTKKINILQLVYGFGVGGGELKLLELLRYLNRDKYNITVVSVGLGGPLEEKFRELGFPTFIISKSSRFDLTLPFKLAKIMRETQTDLMMSTLFFADIIGAAATLLYKPRAFVSWEVITGQLRVHQKWMYKMFASRFDMVAAVSNSIHPFIEKDRGQDPKKIRTIYYGVDLKKYAPRKKKNDDKIIFGTVARLVHQKGHTFLLDAIPAVLEKYPNARWRFVGGGDKESVLRQQAERLGIAHAVEFTGNQSDVPSFLHSFDVFVLPSLWEGFPNVLLEAMACGLPVIATSVEGTIELVVDDETGILVPKENPQALTAAMMRVLESPNLIEQFGKAGRQRVEEHFSLEKQVREFEELYDKLCNA